MRFIVDAQLPRRQPPLLAARGHDVFRAPDLPDGNRTSDAAIVELAGRDNRIAVARDADCTSSHLLTGRPLSLVLLATGNMGDSELQRLLEGNIEILDDALSSHRFLELGRDCLLCSCMKVELKGASSPKWLLLAGRKLINGPGAPTLVGRMPSSPDGAFTAFGTYIPCVRTASRQTFGTGSATPSWGKSSVVIAHR